MIYEVFIDGNFWDEVEAIDEAGAINVAFDRLDGKVGKEIHAEPVEGSDEPGICPACNGSGEGQHEGSRCHSCKGRGEA
jgi:hypothetical protein